MRVVAPCASVLSAPPPSPLNEQWPVGIRDAFDTLLTGNLSASLRWFTRRLTLAQLPQRRTHVTGLKRYLMVVGCYFSDGTLFTRMPGSARNPDSPQCP
jgi:hypothetical protein